MNKTNIVLILVLFSQFVCADWVQVTGKAPYKEGLYEQAREKAREDALQQAIMQIGSHVKSEQRVVNGILKHDQITVSSQARVNKSLVLDEYIWKGVLHLSMNVDVDEVLKGFIENQKNVASQLVGGKNVIQYECILEQTCLRFDDKVIKILYSL